MKILVTGGAGFIGRWIVKKLLDKKCDVWVIDDLSNGRKENVEVSNTTDGETVTMTVNVNSDCNGITIGTFIPVVQGTCNSQVGDCLFNTPYRFGFLFFFYVKIFSQIPKTISVYRQPLLLRTLFQLKIGVCTE